MVTCGSGCFLVVCGGLWLFPGCLQWFPGGLHSFAGGLWSFGAGLWLLPVLVTKRYVCSHQLVWKHQT